MFTHLLDGSGALVSQADGWPVGGLWPPTCWRQQDQIVDIHRIPLPPDLAPGRFSLMTGLYDARDLSRVAAGDGRTEIELVQIDLR